MVSLVMCFIIKCIYLQLIRQKNILNPFNSDFHFFIKQKNKLITNKYQKEKNNTKLKINTTEMLLLEPK